MYVVAASSLCVASRDAVKLAQFHANVAPPSQPQTKASLTYAFPRLSSSHASEQMSVEGQETMQQVVQDAMAGMSSSGQGAPQDDAYSTDRDGEGVVGEGGGSDGGGGGGRDGGGGLLDESMSREQREEEWSLRMAETEDAMVRTVVVACRRCLLVVQTCRCLRFNFIRASGGM